MKRTNRSSRLGYKTPTEFTSHPQSELEKVHYENTVAMPNGLSEPSAFGMYALRTGGAL